MKSSKRCSSVSRHDILDCSRTQYTTYAEFFTEVTGNEWYCATVYWHAVRIPGTLPSSREPGAGTCNVFRRIHTAHMWPEGVVLTREANVWKSRSFLTFLPCFEYRTTGQTAAHFRQVTCCAKNSHPLVYSYVSAQLRIIMHKLCSVHHQIYPWNFHSTGTVDHILRNTKSMQVLFPWKHFNKSQFISQNYPVNTGLTWVCSNAQDFLQDKNYGTS